MNRRNFFKLLGASGLSLCLPVAPILAEERPERFLIMLSCFGGWDPTSVFDPKGNINPLGRGPVNNFSVDQIRTIGAFSLGPQLKEDGYDFANFFSQYKDNILLFNGVDNGGTNNHLIATRIIWSGVNNLSYPCLAALFAAVHGPTLPISFFSNGYYDNTSELVAKAKMGNTAGLFKIAYPNRISPNNESNIDTFIQSSVYSKLQQYKQERIAKLLDNETLPQRKAYLRHLYNMKSSNLNLTSLVEALPAQLETNNLKKQAQLACAAFASGVCASANVNVGGFDTHGQHDLNQYNRLSDLFSGLEFLMQEAERHGIQDKLTVVVGSDFGRTPWYNRGQGKDHWPIGSLMVIDSRLRGNRVIGGTNEKFQGLPISPETLETLEKGDASGEILSPAMIHLSLREFLGLSGSDLLSPYPLNGETIDFFS